ncbi:gp53-like domain-containing protein, partial [Xenorhabdus bharatensis]|uniref:gp53-like domain-containing protein n=1 Tax=Xenorhabdus bharatensis TaxID=3136256 RepID=UPI003BF5E60E
DVWANRYVLEKGQRVYSPNNPQTDGHLAPEGWYRDTAKGVIIQWGRGWYKDNQVVNFPTPFPTMACSVQISANPADTNNAEVSQAYPLNATSFIVGCGAYRDGRFYPSAFNCTWMAIGY